MKSTARVSSLVVYPVKGCAGISVESSAFTARGLAHDREWCIVAATTGRFVTQRQDSRLALVCPQLDTAELVLTAPSSAAILRIPLSPAAGRELRNVSVWEWQGAALDEGDAAAAWLSAALPGRQLRLVRFLEEAQRPVDARFAAAGNTTRFSDGFPFLLLSDESMQSLNARLEKPVPANRFRANVGVAGGAAFEEDAWHEITIGGYAFINVKPCSRCKVPTIEQTTGEEGLEPIATLHSFRTGRALSFESSHEQWAGSVFFGANMVAGDVRQTGELHVGDAVHVLTTQEWRIVSQTTT
jgi:uncharacterized protein YcbX